MGPVMEDEVLIVSGLCRVACVRMGCSQTVSAHYLCVCMCLKRDGERQGRRGAPPVVLCELGC